MSRLDAGQVRGFLADQDARRSRKYPVLYPDERPPEIPKEQSDISVTSKSSRVDEYNYGMNRTRRTRSVSLPENQMQDLAGSGGLFEASGEGNDVDAYVQTLTVETTTSPVEAKVPLLERLYQAMQMTKTPPQRDWLPFGDLERICRPSDVLLELQQHFSKQRAADLTLYVCGDTTRPQRDGDLSRRIFVVLILINKIETLPSFKNAELRDKHLPFEWSDTTHRHLISPRSPFGSTPLPCFGQGGMSWVLRRFYEYQWKTVAPIISLDDHNGVKTFHLAEDVIMPWTFFGSEKKEGGFSTVRKVEIHEDHHSFHEHKAFALKTLLETEPDYAEDEFEKELKAFTRMEPGDHLLDLCATFKIGEEYSFLFPWAEGGTLEKFWTNCPTKVRKATSSQDLLRWVAEQCHGLALALQSIHDVRVKALIRAGRILPEEDTDDEFYGIHGDIKPGNILLFDQHNNSKSIGILKIADFGLTEFHRLRSRTFPRSHSRYDRHPAPTYDAPELAGYKATYSRKADVWALGCVFTEFLVWAMHGNAALTEYGDARFAERDIVENKPSFKKDSFFVANHHSDGNVETFLKESVIHHLDQLCLESNTKDVNFITQFCHLLKDKVLVCDRKKRISCDDLVVELSKPAWKARNSRPDDPYWALTVPCFSEMDQSSTVNVPEIVAPSNETTQVSSRRSHQKGAGSMPRVSFSSEVELRENGQNRSY